jgi:uncharacterized membrane protein
MGQQSEPGRLRWGRRLRGAPPVAGRDELVTGAIPEAQAGDGTGLPAGSGMAEDPGMAGQPAAGPVPAGQPAATGVAAPGAVAAAGHPERGTRRKLLYVTLPGCWGALIFACLSFAPSLLPRSGLLQGVVTGITAATGYGLGVWAASIWRAFADRGPRRPRRWAWTGFFVSAGVLLAVSFGFGQYWQYDIRKLMGVTKYNIPLVIASPVIAVAVFCLIVAIGRGLRGLYRWVAGRLGRWMGPRAARGVGWALVVGLTYLVVSGLLLQGLVNVINSAYSLQNNKTAPGVQQPATSLRSGGPGSLIRWDSLGYQGRSFAGAGPSAVGIESVTHRPAMEPIRIYAGLKSADGAQAQASLAVKDLQRAGGFSRKNLLVVTTTGSGWVVPALVDSFEYLSDGNSATVAIQYSYLPSWVSYLVDKSKALTAGQALFDAVYGVWVKLPPAHRPRLFVSGESLGSFGGEAAFTDAQDMANLTSGVLFSGPPSFNTLFGDFRDHRQPGSPEVQPVYQDGQIVRFANDPAAGIPPSGQPWNGTRVLYLLHPSDPVVWWSPDLIFSEPDWTSQPPGRDVLSAMFWVPLVTFWLVTADLPFAASAPAGHGHVYTTEFVDGWNAVMRPAGITPGELATLRGMVANGG